MSRAEPRPKLRRLAAMTLGVAVLGAAAESLAQHECLVTVKGAGRNVADTGTLCAGAQNKSCLFQLQLCLNQADAGCAAASMKKKVKAKGRCGGLGKLSAKPDGSSAICGTAVGVKVKTRKKGKREGKCKIRVVAKASGKPKRRDVDTLTLLCKPQASDCPTTTTTTIPRPVITGPCITPCSCCVLPATELGRCVSD